jgi:nucleoside-diphosphate-sugar epimerase
VQHLDKKTAIVFGASGFIGSHTCQRLSTDGWKVVAVSRSRPVQDSHSSDATWVPHPIDVSEVFKRFEPKLVINAAVCYGRQGEPLSVQTAVNCLLPIQLAEQCEAIGCPRFVHVDTFSWKPRTGACVKSAYTMTKKFAWEVLESMSLRCCSIAVARLEFPYGPRDRSHKFVSKLLSAFVSNSPDFAMSDGLQERDFVWIDDVSAAISLIGGADLPLGLTDIEIGTGHTMPVRRFAEILCAATGANTVLRFGELPRIAGEMERSVADLTRLSSFGFVPKTSVADGCAKLATHINSTRSIGSK